MRQVSTTFVLTQYLCSDELEGPVRTLKFEINGVAYSSNDVEIENATLLQSVETHDGELLFAQTFNRTDALAKTYGGWFLNQLKANDSLRETIEDLLVEDYECTQEADADRLMRDREVD